MRETFSKKKNEKKSLVKNVNHLVGTWKCCPCRHVNVGCLMHPEFFHLTRNPQGSLSSGRGCELPEGCLCGLSLWASLLPFTPLGPSVGMQGKLDLAERPSFQWPTTQQPVPRAADKGLWTRSPFRIFGDTSDLLLASFLGAVGFSGQGTQLRRNPSIHPKCSKYLTARHGSRDWSRAVSQPNRFLPS